jgi:hypothetical protein
MKSDHLIEIENFQRTMGERSELRGPAYAQGYGAAGSVQRLECRWQGKILIYFGNDRAISAMLEA